MKIGLLLAIELDAVFAHYDDVSELHTNNSFRLFLTKKNNNEIYILKAGVGLVYAAAACQYLISVCHVDIIVNFGVVGGLTNYISKSDVVVIDRVVHYRFDASQFEDVVVGQLCDQPSEYIHLTPELVEKAINICPSLTKATCCSADQFVTDIELKQYLHNHFGGDVVDMELAGMALIANQNHIPIISFKAVSDALDDGVREYRKEFFRVAMLCLATADKLIETL